MPSSKRPSPALVAGGFVSKYYPLLESSPHKLHQFYGDDSTFLHCRESEEPEPVRGKAAIKAAFLNSAELFGEGPVKVAMETLDAQASGEHSVVVLTTGKISVNGAPAWTFAQTFFITPMENKPTSFYVLNDAFRIMPVIGAAPVPPVAAPPAAPLAPAAPAVPKEEIVPLAPAAPAAPAAKATAKGAAKTAAMATACPPPVALKQPTSLAAAAPPKEEAKEPAVEAKAAAAVSMTWAQRAQAMAANSQQAAPEKPKVEAAKDKDKIEDAKQPPAEQVVAAGSKGAPAAVPTRAPKQVAAKQVVVGSIFVRGVPASATAAQLDETFRPFGDIKAITIRDERGFAFVDFTTAEAAAAAKSTPVTLGGEALSVEARNSKPSSGGAKGPSKGGKSGKGKGKGKGAGRGGRT